MKENSVTENKNEMIQHQQLKYPLIQSASWKSYEKKSEIKHFPPHLAKNNIL